MPPRFATLRSRTNSILDTITGAIPDSPPNGTFKDRSLTCRKCGNRFRDTLELDRHFNLFPDHSDYGDSHDYDSFIRAKVSRRRSNQDRDAAILAVNTSTPSLTSPLSSPLKLHQSFSDSIQPQSPESDEQNKPSFLRKLSTFTSMPLVGSEQSENTPPESASKTKGKAKARGFPQLRREDTGFTQVLDSDDGHSVVREPLSPRNFTQNTKASLPSTSFFDTADNQSITSDSSFRTAGSLDMSTEKNRLAANYAYNDSKSSKRDEPETASEEGSSIAASSNRRNRPARTRHASEGQLLMSTSSNYAEAPPPSYQELHGSSDPFDSLAPLRSARDAMSVPSSPMSTGPRPWLSSRTRSAAPLNNYSASTWSSYRSPAAFPVSFGSAHHDDELSDHMASSSISQSQSQPRPWLSMNTTASSPSPFASSPQNSPTVSPSTPKTPSYAFANFALPLSPSSPSQTRDRRASRSRTESNSSSTRCPTCFAKYSSMASVLKHLDNSECGAVEFDSGII